MNQKLQTPLHNFRYSRNPVNKSFLVNWYHYNLYEDQEDERGFTYEELNIFQNYVIKNDINFGGLKNYFKAEEYEVPIIIDDDFVPNDRLSAPEYLILKPNPRLQRKGICKAMDIMLLDHNGNSNHSYNLPFGAIGKIEKML